MSAALQTREADEKIIRFEALRSLIEEKFPESAPASRGETVEEPALVPPGLLTEISGSLGSVSLAMHVALQNERSFAGLVDASDALDPSELPQECLRRLLWVRCERLAAAIQAVDLLLRDGNLPLVFLDLRMVPAQELRSIPASAWHRFQRLLEQGSSALGLCTARPCISAARVRVRVTNQWTLRDMLRPREELTAILRTQAQRRGAAPLEESERRIA